jgi:glycosyltransferase involved in cell wall biosynthesis
MTENRDSLKPLFAVGGLYSLSNGVAWIMRDLAAALGRAGSPVDVYGADCWGRGATSVGHVFEPPSRWFTAPGIWLGGLSVSPQLKWMLNKAVAQSDIVHNHSVWMLPNSYSSRAAERHNKPVVFTAHGTLEPWSVQNSGWKKKLVAAWFQNRDLHRASCLIVNNATEIDGIRQYGLKNPIAVIPNGVYLPDLDRPVSPDVFFEKFPNTRGKRIGLFMARIHEKKGLGHLLPAFGRLAAQLPDWHLVIAGPDCGDLERARGIVAEYHIQHRVTFTGALQGDLKASARAAAEVFLQPSFSEGFSMAIIEALACRLPVLLTPGCNFPEAVAAGAAISTEHTDTDCELQLEQLLSRSPQELKAMGQLGRALIESRYQWDNVAEETLVLYRWLIRGGTMPDFVAL